MKKKNKESGQDQEKYPNPGRGTRGLREEIIAGNGDRGAKKVTKSTTLKRAARSQSNPNQWRRHPGTGQRIIKRREKRPGSSPQPNQTLINRRRHPDT
jgi:hypothetical protein